MPFRRFEGEWLLRSLAPAATKIEFSLRWEFGGGLANTLAGHVFARIANTYVDAFVALVRTYGIKELVRTGAVVMSKGSASIEEATKR